MKPDDALANHVTTAMEQYARRHSAALLIIHSEDDIKLGSATCVSIGSRFLLATAGHNLDGVTDDRQIRVVPPSGAIEEWLPFTGRNATPYRGDSSIDVAWLELDPAVASKHGLEAICLDRLKPYETPTDKVLYLVKGLPAARVQVKTLADLREIRLTSVGYLTIPSDDPVGDPSVDLALEYQGTAVQSDSRTPIEMTHPKGMSGGGIWTLTNFPYDGIWAPSRCQFVAITRSYHNSRRQLLGVLVQHWLAFVAGDFPELSAEIHDILERRRENSG